MSDAFISYRRKPSSALAQLIKEKLENRHNITAYLDVTRADSTKVQFPERLMQAIADSPTFICLLADSTLDSEWVRKEIIRAYELRKHCIPVFQESYVPQTFDDPAVDYLLNFDGVKIFDVQNVYVDESIGNIAKLIIRTRKRNGAVLMGGVVAVFVLIAIALVLIWGSQNEANTPTSEATTQVALVTEELLSPTPSETATTRPTDTPTDEPSPDLALFLAQTQTREVQLTELARPTNTPQPTPNYDATLNVMASQTALARPTITATLSPEQLALTPVAQNEAWTPVEREFDGVIMVLVPAGCFMMGSDASSAEQPIHEQCFDIPFWIDKYEVTQAQFVQFDGQKFNANYFTGEDLPVERITWFEARDYCENNRGGRLPTEAEWEYTSRGPSNLIYPWGNDFVADNVVYGDNSNSRTAPVGSRAGGLSWVGALDMSGNVWEWVSSLYVPYPYSENSESVNDNSSIRVLRGGSWFFTGAGVRSAVRIGFNPSVEVILWGFRCVRSQ